MSLFFTFLKQFYLCGTLCAAFRYSLHYPHQILWRPWLYLALPKFAACSTQGHILLHTRLDLGAHWEISGHIICYSWLHLFYLWPHFSPSPKKFCDTIWNCCSRWLVVQPAGNSCAKSHLTFLKKKKDNMVPYVQSSKMVIIFSVCLIKTDLGSKQPQSIPLYKLIGKQSGATLLQLFPHPQQMADLH